MIPLVLTLLAPQYADAGKILYVTNRSGSYNSSNYSYLAGRHSVTRVTPSTLASYSASTVSSYDAVYFSEYIGTTEADQLYARSAWASALTGRVLVTGLHAEGHGKYPFINNAVTWGMG